MAERRGGRGWGRVLGLLLVCIAFSAVQPALLVFVPFGLLTLGLPPRRPVTVIAGLIMLGAALAGMRPEGLAAVERAWALLVGGWFLLAIVLMPRQGFVTRGLTAVGGAYASGLGLLALRDGALARIDEAFAARLRNGAATAAQAWGGTGESGAGEELAGAIRQAAEIQVAVYPALLALATLAGLAVAWWAWGRLARRPDGGLAPLREFRFSDALIWVLILGIALVLVPSAPALLGRAGSNLLAFMVALYALRGFAVALFVWGVPGPGGMVLAALATVLLYPVVVATSVMLGVFDTWLDIRTRRPASPGPDA